MLRIELEDNEYPKQKLTHVRKIARAVVLSKEGKIAIIHQSRFMRYHPAKFSVRKSHLHSLSLQGALL